MLTLDKVSQKRKCALFDELFRSCFERNFGTLSKTELETLLFKEYIAIHGEQSEPDDDFTISKQLGITQAKVRSLKERVALRYPQAKKDWKTEFINAVKMAKYDERDGHVKIIVQDVTVMSEVRNFLESHGWYDEWTLNRKLLNIPVAGFLQIFLNHFREEAKLPEDLKAKLLSLQKDVENLPNVKDLTAKSCLERFVSSLKNSPKAVWDKLDASAILSVIRFVVTEYFFNN